MKVYWYCSLFSWKLKVRVPLISSLFTFTKVIDMVYLGIPNMKSFELGSVCVCIADSHW